jgi:hypothetical protein
MRFCIWLLLFFLVATTGLVKAQGPPATPEARNRPRLKVKEYVVKGKLFSHNDSVLHAADDLAQLATKASKEELYYYRYISIHNIPRDFREDYYNCLSFVLNSLSSRPAIVRPAFGGPDNILIRINLFDYGIDPKAWDRLAKNDPYYHQLIVRTDVISTPYQVYENVPTGLYYGGDRSKPEYKQQLVTKSKVETKVTKEQASAAWLDPTAVSYLIQTTQSAFPILRGDWFISNVLLEPAYSDFLNVKSLNDFKKLTAFDARAAIKEAKATIVTSGSDGFCPKVARNNRILARLSTFQGYFWQTYDFKESIGERNVINNFLNDKRDAGEMIATLPNGLQAYLVTNEKDAPVAEGDIKIVTDPTAADGRVRNARSCVVCHSFGINQFKSHFQLQVGVLPDQSNLLLYDKDIRKALGIQQRVREVFGSPNFDEIIADDNRIYAKAIQAVNGLTSLENATNYKTIYNGYVEELIDTRHLVFEIGLMEEEVKNILALKLNGKSNGVLVQQLLTTPISIRRDQFEEAFAELALLSTIIRPIKPYKK